MGPTSSSGSGFHDMRNEIYKFDKAIGAIDDIEAVIDDIADTGGLVKRLKSKKDAMEAFFKEMRVAEDGANQWWVDKKTTVVVTIFVSMALLVISLLFGCITIFMVL